MYGKVELYRTTVILVLFCRTDLGLPDLVDSSDDEDEEGILMISDFENDLEEEGVEPEYETTQSGEQPSTTDGGEDDDADEDSQEDRELEPENVVTNYLSSLVQLKNHTKCRLRVIVVIKKCCCVISVATLFVLARTQQTNHNLKPTRLTRCIKHTLMYQDATMI